ncbi:MAG: hypothetical protein ACYTKD_00495 [Planctomycetota bacterium]|jgi:hypothetical protein
MTSRLRKGCRAALSLAFLALTACVREQAVADRAQTPRRIPQAEIQDDIQRFSGYMIATLADTMRPLVTSDDPVLRLAASRHLAGSLRAAIEIATGPEPEVNLLDMVTFVVLSRIVMDDYYLPELYGSQGEELREAFVRLERGIWGIADQVLDEKNRAELLRLISEWRRDNPTIVHVGWVRLFAFSEIVGRAAEARSAKARGLLASMKKATETGDRALLLGERAAFLIQRLPLLAGTQLHVTSQTVLAELGFAISKSEGILDEIRGLRPLVADAERLTEATRALVLESKDLAVTLDRLFPTTEGPSTLELTKDSLEAASELVEKSLALTAAVKESSPAAAREVDRLTASAHGLLGRSALYLSLAGALWATFFWAGYYIVKRALASHRRGREPGQTQ